MCPITTKIGPKEQVIAGVRAGLGCVAGICVGCLLLYGVLKLRFPQIDNSLFYTFKDYNPRLVGVVCVAAATAILWATVDHWAKMLAGFFGYSVFGGLLAVAAGGFRSHIASLQLSRLGATLLTVLFAICALLTIRLSRRKLHWVDRVAALSAPLLLALAGTSDSAVTGFKVVASLVIVFASAGLYDYVVKNRQTGTKET
jgi:hypothetical protein